MMNPILEFILKAGIHYNHEQVTPDQVLTAILNELNSVGAGISAWTNNGIVMVELEELKHTAARILIQESMVKIVPEESLKIDPRATLIAFSTISAVENLHT